MLSDKTNVRHLFRGGYHLWQVLHVQKLLTIYHLWTHKHGLDTYQGHDNEYGTREESTGTLLASTMCYFARKKSQGNMMQMLTLVHFQWRVNEHLLHYHLTFF